MTLQQIRAIFCCLMILSGCATTTTYEFVKQQTSINIQEFDDGYRDGIAFANTEGLWSGDSKTVPSFMKEIIKTETGDYQNGFAAGYREQRTKNSRKATILYWGLFFPVLTGFYYFIFSLGE